MAVPADTISADPTAGTARYKTTDLACRDSGFVLNGIVQGPWQAAKVSWDVQWAGPAGHSTVNDDKNRFRLDATETKAVINWSAEGPGQFIFKCDPDSSNAVYALVGRERNGVFY